MKYYRMDAGDGSIQEITKEETLRKLMGYGYNPEDFADNALAHSSRDNKIRTPFALYWQEEDK